MFDILTIIALLNVLVAVVAVAIALSAFRLANQERKQRKAQEFYDKFLKPLYFEIKARNLDLFRSWSPSKKKFSYHDKLEFLSLRSIFGEKKGDEVMNKIKTYIIDIRENLNQRDKFSRNRAKEKIPPELKKRLLYLFFEKSYTIDGKEVEEEYRKKDEVLEDAWDYIVTGHSDYIEELTDLIEKELIHYPELLKLRKENMQVKEDLNTNLNNFERYLLDLITKLQEEYLILVLLDEKGT